MPEVKKTSDLLLYRAKAAPWAWICIDWSPSIVLVRNIYVPFPSARRPSCKQDPIYDSVDEQTQLSTLDKSMYSILSFKYLDNRRTGIAKHEEHILNYCEGDTMQVSDINFVLTFSRLEPQCSI